MMRVKRLFCLLVTAAASCSAIQARAETITVFAAASLTTALTEVAQGYEAQSHDDVALSFAGSSALARQIQLGAPADVLISANPDWMDSLQAQDLIVADSRRDLLGNTLVLIGQQGAAPVEIGPDLDLAEMVGQGHLAMALVEAVPAGIYGRQSLQALGLWDDVATQVVQTDNVRAALALVSLGEAEFGIVYGSDASADPQVAVIGTFPPESHPPITYPVAHLFGPAGNAAQGFLTYLQSPEARTIFEAQGFTVLGD